MVLACASCQSLKSCVKEAFTSTCRSQLYQCFNASDCSYQLHTNTQHISIHDDDVSIPKIYFSNPLALALHDCLNQKCKIGEVDKNYPNTLPADYCVMEVWDICGGDAEEVFAGKAPIAIEKCYTNLCPALKSKLDKLISH